MLLRNTIIVLMLLVGYASTLNPLHAEVTRTYTPWPRISLTGTTSDVRFDVAAVLHGTTYSWAYLHTSSSTLSGAFYINTIGWALMASGSYRVEMDCGTQSLGNLTASCQLTGSGWSENIWELWFSRVEYIPQSGTLSGVVSSFAGDLDIRGIILPLLPASLAQDISLPLSTTHARIFTLSGAELYGPGIWSLYIRPDGYIAWGVWYTLMGWIFQSVDISMSDIYRFTLTDPHGSITQYAWVQVMPWAPSMSINPTSDILAKRFCVDNTTASRCPIQATQYTIDGTSITADGSDAYTVTLRPRDTYGNRVNTGTLSIAYTGTIRTIQMPEPDIMTTVPAWIVSYDPIRFNSVWFTFSSRSTSIPLDTLLWDVVYSINSIAPTDSDNTFLLDAITYTSPSTTVMPLTIDTTTIGFAPPYSASIVPPSSIQIGAENIFDINFSSSSTAPTNPTIYHLFMIWEGHIAEMRNPVLPNVTTGDVDWSLPGGFPTSYTYTPTGPYSFSGIYTPRTAYPTIESVYYHTFIHYMVDGTHVVYRSHHGSSQPVYQASRVKILGQNNARAEYGDIATDNTTRIRGINTLRKNITLLSRGRTTFTDVRYSVHNGDISVNNASLDTHDTIVVIGGDITITTDIARRDSPVALIALADSEWHGGNIRIDSAVTDIHAWLFAEKSVFSSGDSQLYIHGTMVSANTLWDTAAGICPSYVQWVCNAWEYDLEYLRSYDGSSGQAPSSRASQYPNTALIIEYDMRLQTDPPPGLAQ